MLEDDVPYPTEQMRAEWCDDPGWPAEPHGYGTPVDMPYATAREHGYRDEYGYRGDYGDREAYRTGFSPGGEAHFDTRGPHVPKHDRSRGNPAMRAGNAVPGSLAGRVLSGARHRAGVAAALTATAVVGTGTTATVFSFVPVTPPHVPVTSSAAIMPSAASVPSSSPVTVKTHPATHHDAYVGKHRQPVATPTPAMTSLAGQPQAPSGEASPAVAARPAPASSSPASAPAGGSGQAGSSSPARGAGSQPSSPSSSQPSSPPSQGSGSGSGGSSAGGGSSSGSGGSSSGSQGGLGGVVGGLVGGVTGTVGGVLGGL
ncbi:MAG TPA: hypothetical protein VKV80_18090 [Streptosporangiaceae bacterium]|nr:hypothetical protein [Streptosporangiaceae bacterium]